MCNDQKSHGNVYGAFISLEGWWTLAGGNTPGNDATTLHPGGVPESTVGYPISPIRPIRPIPPHPKSTLAHPKSTVDLGCEPLIRVDNGLIPSSSRTRYRLKSGPKTKESGQNQTVTDRKNLFLIAAHDGRPRGPFASHCQVLPTIASRPPTPFVFFDRWPSAGGRDAVTGHAQSRPVAPGRA